MRFSKYTYEQQRVDIQKDINDYFGKTINITPRAMAALQAGETNDGGEDGETLGVFQHCVMDSLIKSSPSCAMLLFNSGVMLEKLRFPPQIDRPAPLGSNTLELIFEGSQPDQEQRLTKTAKRVKRTATLTDYDILTSALEAELQGTDYMDFAGALLEAGGVREPTHIRGFRKEEASQWAACEAYLSRILKRVQSLKRGDPSHAFVQFALYQDDSGIVRLRPFGFTEISRLSIAPPILEDQDYVYRGGILQPLTSIAPGLSDSVLEEFEQLLNSPHASEHNFQRLLQEHPFLLSGLDFGKAHPQPILYKDDGGSLIPDFFLEKLDDGIDAIVDLKRAHDAMVIRRQNRTYFSQKVHNAMAQLRYYAEWFDSPSNRRLFEKAYGVRTFRPKMIIVIGRTLSFADDIERIRLTEGLSGKLELWTYDDVYNRAQRYLNFSKRHIRISS